MLNLKNLFGGLVLVVSSSLAFAAPVNVNTADAESLAKVMNGVGLKKAQAIVAYRNQYGPFRTLEEVAQVKGIGKKTVDKNMENLTVSN